MTEDHEIAIGNFFEAAEKLKNLGIIRSDKYLGDIAEFICTSTLGMAVAKSGRQPGHDGHIDGKKVQVKFNGGTSTTVECGNPDEYEELIVVLGPNSVMRQSNLTPAYLIYRIPSATIKEKNPHNDGKRRLSKNQLPLDCLITVK